MLCRIQHLPFDFFLIRAGTCPTIRWSKAITTVAVIGAQRLPTERAKGQYQERNFLRGAYD
jgi:hypothetical protein